MIKKNSEKLASLLLAVLLGSSLFVSVCQSGTQAGSISINKAPLDLKTLYFEDKPELEHHRKDMNYDAFTQWFFHCEVDLKTKDIKREDTIGAASVTLAVTGVEAKLSCPVEMCISKKTENAVIEHERGHVDICQRFYAMSEGAVQKAGRYVMEREFYGMGATPEDARKMALDSAYQMLGNMYQQAITLPCEATSEKFDQLSLRYLGDTRKTPKVLVDMAMREANF